MSVESEAFSGKIKPSTRENKEVIEKVCQIVMKDCSLTQENGSTSGNKQRISSLYFN